MVKIEKESNNNRDKIYQIFKRCCEDFRSHFNQTRKLISQNLLKLRLGIVEKTVDDVVTKFFEEGMKKLREDFQAKVEELLMDTNKEFSEKSANVKV